MIKSVAVLTSGGDAPGMNAAIRAVVRTGIKKGLKTFVVYEGYKGLYEGNIVEVDRNFVSDIINRGGTSINSARLPEFKEEEVRKVAVEQLRKHNIDALVVIGGDGSYMGAKRLTEMGIATIGLPGTIDNDIASTDYTIGFDTALNTICDCVDKIRDTNASHLRCTFIEVMGNHCGDLALFSGLAEGVEMVITPDHPISKDEIIERLKQLKFGFKKHALIVVSEKMFPDIYDLAKEVQVRTGFEVRADRLGHLQRGGKPSAFDRILAARCGVKAVELLLEGKSGVCVGMRKNEIVYYDIMDALKMKRDIHHELIKMLGLVNR